MGKIAFPSVLELAFLPRDAMRKRDLCRRSVFVRLSVCLFIAFVYCIQMADDIVKLLSRPDSPIILVFLTMSADTQFQRESLQRGRTIHGVGMILDFRLKSPFVSETVRERPMVIMER